MPTHLRPSLSVIVPALNERENIEAAVRDVLGFADRNSLAIEIRVMTCTDKSGLDDGTPAIVKNLAMTDPRIILDHSPRYQPLGEKLREGLLKASMEFAMFLPGDGEVCMESLEPALAELSSGNWDLVVCYVRNPEARGIHRRILSMVYTFAVNHAFGTEVRYFNGPNIYRASMIRSIASRTESFAVGAELILRMLRAGARTTEAAVTLRPRHGRSKAFSWANIVGVVREIATLRRTLGAS